MHVCTRTAKIQKPCTISPWKQIILRVCHIHAACIYKVSESDSIRLRSNSDMVIVDYYSDQHPADSILAGLLNPIRPHGAFDYVKPDRENKLTNDQHERREDPILVQSQDTCKPIANRRAYIYMEAE